MPIQKKRTKNAIIDKPNVNNKKFHHQNCLSCLVYVNIRTVSLRIHFSFPFECNQLIIEIFVCFCLSCLSCVDNSRMCFIIVSIMNTTDGMSTFNWSINISFIFWIIVLNLTFFGQIDIFISLFIFC